MNDCCRRMIIIYLVVINPLSLRRFHAESVGYYIKLWTKKQSRHRPSIALSLHRIDIGIFFMLSEIKCENGGLRTASQKQSWSLVSFVLRSFIGTLFLAGSDVDDARRHETEPLPRTVANHGIFMSLKNYCSQP